MNILDQFFSVRIFYLLLIIFISCEEAALPIDEEGTPLSVDTVSFPVTNSITYQTPPILGSSDYLYFGEKNDYKYLFNLIRFDSTAVGGGYPFDYYNDTLVVADSMKITLRFISDSIDQNTSFQVKYFPQSDDSVFNELTTNYMNFEESLSSNIISKATMVADSIDSVNTKVTLNFLIDTTVLNVFKDTSNLNFNNSFLIELTNDENYEYKFHSSDLSGGEAPELKVYYRTFLNDTIVIDTTYRTYKSIEDISIIKPPKITSEDTTYLSIGTAKGLKSLLFVDMDGWRLPARGIIRSAELILNSIDSDTTSGLSINAYPLTSDAVFSNFLFHDEDPFLVDVTLMASSVMENNILKINLRNASTDIANGKKKNQGFKILSNSSNDPFKVISFYGLDNSIYYPAMRVIYVYP